MADLTVGRVALGSRPPDKNVFAAAVEDERRRARMFEEKADEYKRLLGAVYSYCAADVRAYGGVELDIEVRNALGLPVEGDL